MLMASTHAAVSGRKEVPMFTKQQIDAEVLNVLMNAAKGKDPASRPKALSAYQIAGSMEPVMADHLISQGGIGGAKGGPPAGRKTLTQEVQHSARRLEDRGLVRHFYMDTRDLSFEVRGQNVRPSFPVMGVYQYAGPTTATPSPSAAAP
jgi:hypothetical protein